MSIREISFPSANGRDTIKAWSYSPLGEPKGVIQLIHGYGEHSRRYLHMISKFNQAGYVILPMTIWATAKPAWTAALWVTPTPAAT